MKLENLRLPRVLTVCNVLYFFDSNYLAYAYCLTVGDTFLLQLPLVKCINQDSEKVGNYIKQFFGNRPINFVHGSDASIKWFLGGMTLLLV
jgi:K+ transporter